MAETIASFEMIPLCKLVPSPTNPRKFFDEDKTKELAASIKEKGVLQPILVRLRSDTNYEIVAGERRYRASKLVFMEIKERDTVPAIIRQLDDQEVREMQLIENFQREDVHPMEEAVAIKAAVDGGKYSFEDIAAKVGKKIHYIRQRMKLNDLTPEWQKLFFRHGVSIGDAFKLCTLPAQQQKEIYKDQVGKDDGTGTYSINTWVLDRYKGNLHSAAFDLNDAALDKKVGACSGCQFNTAVSQLFPEDVKSPRCTNIACFKHKSDIHFKKELQKAIDDPTIILIYDHYGEPDIVKQLRKEGHEVLREGYYHDVQALRSPTKPDWLEFKEENDDEDMTEAEIKKNFDAEMKDYEEQQAAFDKKVATGKYKKAFMVYDDGYDTGKFVFVEINKKGATKEAKKAVEKGTAGIEDIDAEITRIREREKRSKELDGEKVWREINALYSDKSLIHEGELSSQELTAVMVALYEKLDYSQKGRFERAFSKSSSSSIAKGVGTHTHKILNKALRIFLTETLNINYGSHLKDGKQMALKAVIEQYLPEKVKEIEAAQAVRAEKRQKNVDKRITQLQETKKELLKEEKPKPATKAATKRAPVKKAAKKKS